MAKCPCKLYRRRVPAHGSKEPEIYIVGEAPGHQEEIEGLPFIGASGTLLHTALRIVGRVISRKIRVRINNTCQCTPRSNDGSIRTPTYSESINCSRVHLFTDIAKHRPSKGIVALGKNALAVLLETNIKNIKGKINSSYNFHGIPVFAYYHPSYILRNGGTHSNLFSNLIDLLEEILTGKRTKKNKLQIGIDYELIEEDKVSEIFEKYISPKKVICLDIETNGLAYMLENVKLKCLGIAPNLNKAYIFTPSSILIDNLSVLFNSKTQIIGQNIGFDLGFLNYKYGLKWPQIKTDTMIAGYLLDENQRKYSLLELYRRYLPEFAEYKKDAKDNVIHLRDEELYEYNAYDCVGEFRLATILYKKMKEQDLLWLHNNIIIPAIEVIYRKERRGVYFDVPYMRKLDLLIAKQGLEIEKKLRQLPEIKTYRQKYGSIKFTSPLDLRKLFLEHLKYPAIKISKKTKKPSVDVETLSTYVQKKNCKISKYILMLRKAQKARSTYLSGLIPKLINNIGYPTYNLTRTLTGRLSSGGRTKGINTEESKIKLFQDDIAISDFNIQNIPSKNKRLKNIVRARPGMILISADYDTAEIKCAAAFSRCPAMREFCNDPTKDFHTLVASEVFGIKYNEVTKDIRNIAKTISFGLIYGMSPTTLAMRVNASETEAIEYMNKYFSRMPEVKDAIEQAKEDIRTKGYVVNPFGRRRRFDYLTPEAEREAFNAIIQSFSADLLMVAVNEIDKRCRKENFNEEKIYPLLDVHDNTILELEEEPELIREAYDLLQKCMVINLIKKPRIKEALWGVKPSIDVKIGHSWGKLIRYDEFMKEDI